MAISNSLMDDIQRIGQGQKPSYSDTIKQFQEGKDHTPSYQQRFRNISSFANILHEQIIMIKQHRTTTADRKLQEI